MTKELATTERRWILASLFTTMVVALYDEWGDDDEAKVMDMVQEHFILYGIPGHPGLPKEIALPTKHIAPLSSNRFSR